MAGRPFITVRCPSCGSSDVEVDRPGHYRCDHCESLFLHQDTKKPSVASGPPIRARSASPILGVAMIVGAVGASLAIYATVSESEPEPAQPPPEPVSSGHEVREANVEKMRAAATGRDTQRAAVAQSEPEPELPEPHLITDEPESEPEPEPEPIRIEAYQPLSGCECKADLDGDGRRESIQLALKASVVGTWITSEGTSREVKYDFIVRDKKKGEPFRLALDETTAPPHRRRGEVMDLGIACETDRLILAADQRATAWSLRSQSVEWTSELPASFVTKGNRPPSTGPTIHCATMRVRKGAVTVQLPGGTIALSTDTGAES